MMYTWYPFELKQWYCCSCWYQWNHSQ